LVTVIVVACTGIATAQSSSTPIAHVVARLIASFISLCGCDVEGKTGRIRRVKRYWETVRDDLRKAGWNCGCISSTDHEGRQFWVVAAEREDAGRFIVHADEMLIASLELQAAIHRRFELESIGK
jgi:hypothetical protein